jgi:hypothetical protein
MRLGNKRFYNKRMGKYIHPLVRVYLDLLTAGDMKHHPLKKIVELNSTRTTTILRGIR